MKKALLLFVISALSAGVYAQEKNKNHHKRHKHEKHIRKDKTHMDNGHYDKPGEAAKAPAPVRRAFRGDYPGVTDVTWTKSRGYWTASFRKRLVITKATYKANGDRVNGTYTRNETAERDRPVFPW